MTDFDSRMRPVLEHIVTELLKSQPDDPIPLMLHLLEEMSGKAQKPLSMEEQDELDKLRQQARKFAEKLAKEENSDSEADSSEDEEVADLPAMGAKGRIDKGPRTSVSAEAYGRWNKKAAF